MLYKRWSFLTVISYQLLIEMESSIAHVLKNAPLLGERAYFLNKSRSKFVTIGLCSIKFIPIIKISGLKNDSIVLTESGLNDFYTMESVIKDFFLSADRYDTISSANFVLDFKFLWDDLKKVIRISQCDRAVFLAHETVFELFEFRALIDYSVDILKRQRFDIYIKTLLSGVRLIDGDAVTNALKLLRAEELPGSHNVQMTLELICIYPEHFKFLCEKH